MSSIYYPDVVFSLPTRAVPTWTLASSTNGYWSSSGHGSGAGGVMFDQRPYLDAAVTGTRDDILTSSTATYMHADSALMLATSTAGRPGGAGGFSIYAFHVGQDTPTAIPAVPPSATGKVYLTLAITMRVTSGTPPDVTAQIKNHDVVYSGSGFTWSDPDTHAIMTSGWNVYVFNFAYDTPGYDFISYSGGTWSGFEPVRQALNAGILQATFQFGGSAENSAYDIAHVKFGVRAEPIMPWPRGTDFETFPAEAVDLPLGTILTEQNSIISDTFDSSLRKLVLDGTHSHSGSVAMTCGGISNDSLIMPWLASNAGPIRSGPEVFWYWLYYVSPTERIGGSWGTSEPWLSAYALYGGTLGADRDNYDWQLLVVYIRQVFTEFQMKVVFSDDRESPIYSMPMGLWTKIHIETAEDGLITVSFLTDAGTTVGSFESVPGFMTSLSQHFALHELHVRKEPLYGQMWIDDINYDIPVVSTAISGRDDVSRAEFT